MRLKANKLPKHYGLTFIEEVELSRLAGPFEFPPPPPRPFPTFQIHPLGLVPKENSPKWRTIFHLSLPKGFPDSLNASIPLADMSNTLTNGYSIVLYFIVLPRSQMYCIVNLLLCGYNTIQC